MTLANAVSFTAAASGTGSFTFGTARDSFLTMAQAVTAGTLTDGQTVSYLAQNSLSSPTQREWGRGTFTSAGSGTIARTTVIGTVNAGVAGSGSALSFSSAPLVSLTALSEDFRQQLSGNLDYYVNGSTGSDSNTGFSSGAAKATIQAVLNIVSSAIDFNGYRITINIADGTGYAGIYLGTLYNSSTTRASLYIKGNTSTPTNVRLGNNSVAPLAGSGYMVSPQIGAIDVWINGVDLRPSNGSCLYADPVLVGQAQWNVGNPDSPDGLITLSGCGNGQPVVSGNFCDLNNLGGAAEVTIAGATLTSPAALFAILQDSVLIMLNAVYTVTGSPTVSLGVIIAREGRNRYTWIWHDSIVGTVNGPKYVLDETVAPGTVLQVNGALADLAGSTAGVLTSGRIINAAGGNLAAFTGTYTNNGPIVVTKYIRTTAPVTKTGDFSVADTENWLINNKAGSTCTVTLPAAASYSGREIKFNNYQTQTVVSASSNVVPQAGGAAGTAMLAATAGKWCTIVSDGTNWVIMQSG